MKKIILSTILVIGLYGISFSQSYKTAAGLRAGFYNGVTIKHFLSSKSALEGIVSTRWKGINLTGLYEIHNAIPNAEGLNWYYGFGGHIGFWNGDNVNWDNNDNGKSYTVIGIDGIVGIEYNFKEIPLNISLDWKPAFNITGHSGFWGDGIALSLRYIFK